jgi:cytochrome c biogenesis protein CcdA
MLSLLITTIITSAIDSLNPVAITQQFVLQGLVKKRHHIWYFIMATAIVNFTSGMLVYFGLASIMKNYMDTIMNRYSWLIDITKLMVGIIMFIIVSYLIMNKKVKALENQILTLKEGNIDQFNSKNTLLNMKSLNPVSLFFIGAVATVCELPTAMPYFAFLSILLNYKLSILSVTLIMLLYNFIYSSPLILLYILYVKCQDKVDKFYNLIKEKMINYSNILTPLVIGGIGVFLIYHSLFNLINI